MSENDFECLANTGVNTPLMAKKGKTLNGRLSF